MTSDAVVDLMFFFVFPLWLFAGFADWFCHRASDIEHTTGVKESFIHLLMFAEAGVALIVGLFLEINAPVLALFIFLFVLHEATGWWDIGYANSRRRITDIEQHAHSFLEVVPLMALSLLITSHWAQFRILIGADPAIAGSLTLRWKTQALPMSYVVTVLSAALLFEIVPYGKELCRCWKTANGRWTPKN